MSFFNKKEDVIKIELTPHGRKLLSEGKLKPSYYAFFDDDILYDAGNGSFTETNSQSKTRILTETPSPKPQTSYQGVESKVFNRSVVLENTQHLMTPIGTNSLTEEKSAAWNLSFLHGTGSSFSKTIESATVQSLQIPQIECDLNYTMSVKNINRLFDSEIVLNENFEIPPTTKPDGTYVKIKPEQILVDIFERNGFSYKDSYEIEVYLYEEDGVLLDKQLKFSEQNKTIEELLANNLNDNGKEVTNEFVEYFLDINTDKNIPAVDICAGLKKLKNNDIFLEIDYECPDTFDREVVLYDSRVDSSDLEDCD